MKKFIKITQIKSSIGIKPKHKATLIGLGLKFIGHSKMILNNPSNLGMINTIFYILKVE